MDKKKIFFLLNLLFSSSVYGLTGDFENNLYYSIELDYNKNDLKSTLDKRAEELASSLGFVSEGQIGELKGHYTFSKRKDKFKRLEHQKEENHFIFKNDTNIKWFNEQHKIKHLYKRDEKFPGLESLHIEDPEFTKQWHLYNREKSEEGNDINVVPVWLQGVTGKGINVCIVDDGLDYEHPDLKDNFFKEGSYDFNDHRQLPTPTLYNDNHGTRCAGQVAAAINDACGVGIAYDAKVSGVRILSGTLTDADEAASLNFNYQENHIYSCSWGPADDGKTCEGPSQLVAKAFKNGIEKGRNNKGSIFVFATGNGGIYGDNCNFDGYTNSIYTISIGAISSKNEHPPYSEPCSAQIAVTYSSGSTKQITTTDVSISNLTDPVCTSNHGGTSAAAPIAAGIFALVLSARPDLTWRDLQRLAIESAIPVALNDEDWVDTVNGRKFNHKFGYGKLDTEILIKNAKTFKLLNPQTSYESEVKEVKKEIVGNVPVSSSIYIKPEHVKNFKHLEHVNVRVNLTHQRRGDVKIDLISPHGIVSHVATSRKKDASERGLENWLFMSVKHWDEDPVGEWKLIAQNEPRSSSKGELVNWTLILWGEELGENENKDNDTEQGNNDKIPIEEKPNSTNIEEKPSTTDKELKPTTKNEEEIKTTKNEEESETVTNSIVPTNSKAEEKETQINEEQTNSYTNIDENPTESPTDITLPDSDKTDYSERSHEAIIAAEFAIGFVVIAGLGFVIWRYTRKRDSRDDIEFQILDQQKQLMADDDEDDFSDENIDEIDEEETNINNKVIFENHFLDEEDDENDNDNIDMDGIELLEDEEYSSQLSV